MTIGKINFCDYSVKEPHFYGNNSYAVKSRAPQSVNNVTVKADEFCKVKTCGSARASLDALKKDIEKAGFDNIRSDFPLRRGSIDIYSNKKATKLDGNIIPANTNMYFIKDKNKKIEYIIHEIPQSQMFINRYNPTTGAIIGCKTMQIGGGRTLKDDLASIDMLLAFLLQ